MSSTAVSLISSLCVSGVLSGSQGVSGQVVSCETLPPASHESVDQTRLRLKMEHTLRTK